MLERFFGKQINIPHTLAKFILLCRENKIFEDTFEESYAGLININKTNFSDPCNIILEKTKAVNDSFNLVERHSGSKCSDVESFIFMSNAYSQRIGALVGMLHGGIFKDVAEHYSVMAFKFAGNQTFPNKEFQEAANFAAYELVKSIDSRINLSGLQKYIFCANTHKDEINFPHESYHFIEWDNILNLFDDLSTVPIVTPDMLNNFITDNKLPNVIVRKELFGEDWDKIIPA